MKKITIVIPALNEEKGIGSVIKEIPIQELRELGYITEILVIDNGSRDKTPSIAKNQGALVIIQPVRGYGNAYKAGFANASGDIIATGDADLTYPFTVLPRAIRIMEQDDYDFINTNRLETVDTEAMSKSHIFGNYLLTSIMTFLFHTPFKDSQSGMWIFKKSIWGQLDVMSSGMPFSQELKIEAFIKGFKCSEIRIKYRMRAGQEKLNTVRDGTRVFIHLFVKKLLVLLDNLKNSLVENQSLPSR